jgi:hypothetical protein
MNRFKKLMIDDLSEAEVNKVLEGTSLKTLN